ncbi:MAG: hypothetical protein GYB65_07555 [Chloroflexi bacterium]|nr:hypothetical protein [Chloroflexota bacterium]
MLLWLQSERARRALVWVVLPLVVFMLAAIFVSWPLARDLDTRAAGAGYGDSYEVIRHGWWTREALLDGQNPVKQDLLVYPDGFTSWVQWTHPLQYLPPALLGLVVSPVTAFNLALLLVLVLNGLSAYWLGMHLTDRQPAAALIGGLVFLAFPAVQGHLGVGHLGIVTLWPAPLFALCLWRVLLEDAGWRTVVWGGVWFALTGLAYVSQFMVVLFPLLLFFGLYLLLRDRVHLFPPDAPIHAQPWLRAGTMALIGSLLLLPFYLPLLSDEGQDELDAVTETGRVDFSADPLAFISPSPFGHLDDLGLVPEYARDVLGTNSAEGSAYLGLVAVVLAGIAVRTRRESRGWLWVALGAMVLSLGPLLKWRDDPVVFRVEDYESYVTLPWALVQQVPVFESTRTPGRFNLTTGLALSALASTGASVILARLQRRTFQAGLVLVLGALILFEYQVWAPMASDAARRPDYFRDLADEEVRAVLTVPVENLLAAKFGMYLQTLHHHPLIGGHALRRTPQDPAVLAILGGTADAASNGTLTGPEAVYVLSAAGVDRVIAHKTLLPESEIAAWRALLGEPAFEDELYAVFVVPRSDASPDDPPPDFTLARADSATGWSETVTVDGQAVRFLADEGAWYLYAPTAVYGELVFEVAPYRVQRPLLVWLDDHLVSGWAGTRGEFRLSLRLEPGFHTLRFEAVDGCDDYPFALTCWNADPLSADCTPQDPPVCISSAFTAPRWEPADPPQERDIALEHGLRLVAYDLVLAPDNSAVHLRLFWEADSPLPDSYALFVHIADPETDVPQVEPVSQYPLMLTNAWPDGTRWQSEVTIPLPEGLSGLYSVNVGWFRASDGARIPLVDGSGDILRLETISLDAARPLR